MADASRMVFTTHEGYDKLLQWAREALAHKYSRWWQQPARWACLLYIAFWRPIVHRQIAKLNERTP